ncbi:MAG: hypothetical protein ACHQ0J_09430 [Candidatus Dormibacterales bacterium]
MADGTITQVDRGDGKVVATIQVSDPGVLRSQGCAPDSVHSYYSGSWSYRTCDTPYALAWDGSSLWALDNGRHEVVRIDPASHEVVDHVALPDTQQADVQHGVVFGWSMIAGGGTLWVSGYAQHSLFGIDIKSRRLVSVETDLDPGPTTLAYAAGAVWVVTVRGINGIAYLDRVDPATTKVVGRFPIEWWSEAITADQGAIYVRGSFGGDIALIDVTTGAVVWTEPGPGFIGRQGIDELGATSTGIWMSGPSTVRIDLKTGLIADRIPIPSASVAAEGAEVWLSELNGTVAEYRWK